MSRFLKFAELRRDPSLQSRVAMDPALTNEYTEAIQRGERLPPVQVVFDRMYYYLVDGWHRCAALEAAGKCEVEAQVSEGTYRDALLASFAANSRNGARRTNADKRQAVERMLKDDQWVKWSDNDIAKHCAVSQPFVGSVRSSLTTVISEKPSERTYTTKHGTQATMRTAGIGRTAKRMHTAATGQPSPTTAPGQPCPSQTPAINPATGAGQSVALDQDADTADTSSPTNVITAQCAAAPAAHSPIATSGVDPTGDATKPESDDRNEIARLKGEVAKLEQHVGKQDATIVKLEQRVRKRDETIRKLKAELEIVKHDNEASKRGDERRRREDRASLTNEVTLEPSRAAGA